MLVDQARYRPGSADICLADQDLCCLLIYIQPMYILVCANIYVWPIRIFVVG